MVDMKAGFQKLIHDIRWHCYHSEISRYEPYSAGVDKVVFPTVTDKKDIILPPLLPEVEDVIKTCHNKYLGVLKTINLRKLPCNLKPDERRAIRSFSDKGLKVVPSDKGGDLCVVDSQKLDLAISEHLRSSPIYRRVSALKIEKLESKINDIWFKVCSVNKIPNGIKNMYASRCTKFASIHVVVKAHKSSTENLVIRPIINSIDSPGYFLSMFLQKMLQPLISNSVLSSDEIINQIKGIEPEFLAANRFPFSLDVINMFHNIPRDGALDMLNQRLLNSQIDICKIPPFDIVRLVAACVSTNHFSYKNQLFFQRFGLPMGNRLSGLLSELFMQKLQMEIFSSFINPPRIFRYVDDILLFTNDESEAQRIFTTFNNNLHNLKFTIELPINFSLPFLDFRIFITQEGLATFDFYRKPMRNENFVNAETALPKQMISNIINNECNRIKSKCSNIELSNFHCLNFASRLGRNGHKPNFLRRALNRKNYKVHEKSDPKFYLNIPFINDTFEHKIKNSLKGLGVRIIIAHKSKKLKHAISVDNDAVTREVCNLPRCQMNNNLCMTKLVVYCITCTKCGASYIGSTFRFLHLRYKEHLSQRSSPIYAHYCKCAGPLTVSVLSSDTNIQRMRIKEALLIKQLKPSLNAKEDLLRTHILFE
jgi:hypothetical protein